jgi:hypothetical protein
MIVNIAVTFYALPSVVPVAEHVVDAVQTSIRYFNQQYLSTRSLDDCAGSLGRKSGLLKQQKPSVRPIQAASLHHHLLQDEPVVLHWSILLSILLLTMLSLVPTMVKIRGRTWFHYLPLLSVPLYVWYEWTMPARYNIRVDLLFILPMLGICVTSCILKFFISAFRRSRK